MQGELCNQNKIKEQRTVRRCIIGKQSPMHVPCYLNFPYSGILTEEASIHCSPHGLGHIAQERPWCSVGGGSAIKEMAGSWAMRSMLLYGCLSSKFRGRCFRVRRVYGNC